MAVSFEIFGNPISPKVIKQAKRTKEKYIKAYGDDSERENALQFAPIPSLDFLNVQNVQFGQGNAAFDPKALIVGNIRMGFGHYRISIAMASCAKALGYVPYWLDLASFDATGSKMIRKQNELYSLASRISQKSRAFNHFFWEPLNRDGFKKLTYNAKDQISSELLVPIFKQIPKDIPFIATHVWPSQGAIHAGMTNVVNAIPDNWPMALHLSEGAIHAVQTPFAYLGYKMLNGFDKKRLKGMPEADLKMVGHFVDHELLVNLEQDNEDRRRRLLDGKPVRILMTVGGAGAGRDMFLAMLRHLLPLAEKKQAALYLNFGDHADVYHYLCKKLPEFAKNCQFMENDYEKAKNLVKAMRNDDAAGIYGFCHKDIFEAVYLTNLLMPHCDLMVTKPSELVYYPIPKVFMKHIGGHEVYGGIHGREIGDATWECEDSKSLNEMLDTLIEDREILVHMTHRIDELKQQGWYDGGYECVRLAVKGRK